MSLSAATAAKKRKDKQLDAVSQEYKSTRECDDRLGAFVTEMGPEGISDTEAWTQSDCETYIEEARRRETEKQEAITKLLEHWGRQWNVKIGART